MERQTTDRRRAQAALQAQADALVQHLDLPRLLAPPGTPVRVGSSAMGLMVRRDVDITVVAPRLDDDALRAFGAVALQLMQRTESIGAVRFRNDRGMWNAEPDAYRDGLYIGLTARDRQGRDMDVRHLVGRSARASARSQASRDAAATPDAGYRDMILAIKYDLAARPATAAPPSAWVYEAVVDDRVEDLAQFDAWCTRQCAMVD